MHRTYDLHLHTTRSDGTVEPEEVLRRCAEAGLDVVALTDHDLISELAPGPHRFGERAVHLLSAAEISATHDGRELHLLVYFPGEAPPAFRDFCREQTRQRAARYDEAVHNIGLEGLGTADVVARDGRRALTRLHLAQDLVRAGHVVDLREAFARYAGDRAGLVPPIALAYVDAIAMARDLGGVTSWAHPSVDDAEAYAAGLARAGLHAMETLRPRLTARDRKRLKKDAKRLHLAQTGGSDWHGLYGQPLGLFQVTRYELTEFLELLAAAA
jgi:predicted metal-dependent phosphoesterase TrpH